MRDSDGEELSHDYTDVLQGFLDAWQLPGPRTLRRADAGTNNLSHFVDTPSGSYFLRVYQNTDEIDRIGYEHALLLELRKAGLSFAVPEPLVARGGQTFVLAPLNGKDMLASLFPLIYGVLPERGDAAQISACAEALGELDNALAGITMDVSLPTLSTHGDLSHVHPLVPNPVAMLDDLSIATEQRARLRTIFEDLLDVVPGLYGQLPQQIIHSDIAYGNVLMLDGRVTGLLDFEFASPDLRAMDLVAGLRIFGFDGWQTGHGWALIEAFAKGYQRKVELKGEEIEALPALLMLREATSMVHWVGRLRMGLTTEENLARRARSTLQLDDWLRAHDAELIDRVRRCSDPSPSRIIR